PTRSSTRRAPAAPPTAPATSPASATTSRWARTSARSASRRAGASPSWRSSLPGRIFLGRTATAALAALFVLCLAWELWLAPLRPGGSLVALKALPLLLPLPGIWRGRRYTYQWSSLFILAYF